MICQPHRMPAASSTQRASNPAATNRLVLRLISLVPCLLTFVACLEQCRSQNDRSLDNRSRPQHVPLEKIRPLVQELDNLFAKGDIAAYLAKFTPDHDGVLAMLGQHLVRLCELTGSERQRKSTIVAGPMDYDNRTVVRIRHVIEWPSKRDASSNLDASSKLDASSVSKGIGAANGASKHFVEDTYLAVHMDANGEVVPTFAIEMPPQVHCISAAKFRCPPCNYEIGGVAGFLCVPLRRERGLALESASFYLIGSDVVVDVHVQIPSEPTTAKGVALQLAEAFAKMEPSARVGIPELWLPPMHQDAPPLGLDAVRVIVELPLDHQNHGGDITIFHVVSFGGVQHVLLVRTSKESQQQHQTAIDELFRSYMLLEINCGDAELATRPLREHTGGMFDGATYRNERYQLELHGPELWRPEHRIGGSAFRVRWSGPNGSQMWLIGHQVPVGMTAWTTATADRWLSYQCSKLGLEPEEQLVDAQPEGQPGSGKQSSGKRGLGDGTRDGARERFANWHAGENGAMSRTRWLTQKPGGPPGQPHRRILHVQVHSDLLLVVDGFGGTQADEEALQAAIRTLHRGQ
jgi:hypothetical protein